MPNTVTTTLTTRIPGPVQSPYPSSGQEGWFGAAPVGQQGPITSVTTTASTTTTPAGFTTTAQANVLVTSVNSILTALRNYGLLST